MNYVSADEAVKLVRSGDTVCCQGGSSVPVVLQAALARRHAELRDVTITSGSSGIFNAINASTSIIAIVEANIEAYLRPQRISDADKANYNSYIHNYNGPVIA